MAKEEELRKSNEEEGKRDRKYHRRKGGKGKRDFKVKSEFNDYTWYVQDKELTNDVSMLNWNVPLGSDALDFGLYESEYPHGSVEYAPLGARVKIPGITAIAFAMTPGVSQDPNSAVNIAARNVFLTLRKSVTSSLHFGAPDAMSVILAEDSIAAFYAWCCRLYGVVTTYSGMNRYIGKALVQAMGVNYEDVATNLVKLKTFIDLFRVKFNQYGYIPEDFGFMKRHTFMCSGVYKDSESIKSQLFVFNPTYFYQWRSFEVDTPTAGSHLTALKFNSTGKTLDQIISYGNNLIAEFIADADVMDILSMFKRAYGEDKAMDLKPLPENYVLTPVYSENLLGQIHNAHIVRFPYTWLQGSFGNALSHFAINQVASVPIPGGYNDFYIQTTPLEWRGTDYTAEGAAMAWNIGLLFRQFMDTYRKDAPTLEELIDNTRSMVTFNWTGDILAIDGANYDSTEKAWAYSNHFTLESCGLDIWHEMTVYVLGPDQQSLGSGVRLWSGHLLDNNSGSTAYMMQSVADITAWAPCDWMPRVCVWQQDSSFNKLSEEAADKDAVRETIVNQYYLGDLWDYNNPAVITSYNIETLHTACLLGAFKVKLEGNAWK